MATKTTPPAKPTKKQKAPRANSQRAASPAPRRTQQQRSETTTRQLLDTARMLFARDGYAPTSLETVVSECGVTKGALYHHFEGKRELFEAVFEEEQQRVARSTWAAYDRVEDPIDATYAAARAFFDVVLDPGIQRISLIDAPSVLGYTRMREIQSRYGLLMMKEAFRGAMDAERIPKRNLDALAHLMFGALCEGAMYMARAENQRAARRNVEREFRTFIAALETRQPG